MDIDAGPGSMEASREESQAPQMGGSAASVFISSLEGVKEPDKIRPFGSKTFLTVDIGAVADAQDPREIALLEQVLVAVALQELEDNAAQVGVSSDDITTLVAAVTDSVVGQDSKLCTRVMRCMIPSDTVPEVVF